MVFEEDRYAVGTGRDGRVTYDDCGTEGGRGHESCHCTASDHRVGEYVGVYTAGDGDGSGGADAGQEAKNVKSREVGRQGAGHRPDDIAEKGIQHDGTASVSFAQGTKDQRCNDIADEVGRHRKREVD